MERITPKLARMAETGVATMLADGALDGAQLGAWRGWTEARPDRAGPDGYIRVPTDVAALFKAALAREAARLERALAETDDPDDTMDLALIRTYVPAA